MSVDVELERLYNRIKLISGPGSPWLGRLCVMSFVAYLAGASHGDRPMTASPLIRCFAIKLNDGAPAEWRQELKPFAPSIIGTNDGRDRERGKILLQAIMQEVLPRARTDFGPGFDGRRSLPKSLLPAIDVGFDQMNAHGRNLDRLIDKMATAYGRGDYASLSTWAGSLLADLVCCAPDPGARRWYWGKALELLDRLCDVGAEERTVTLQVDRVAQLGSTLDYQRAMEQRLHNLFNGASKATQAIPELCRAVLHHIV